ALDAVVNVERERRLLVALPEARDPVLAIDGDAVALRGRAEAPLERPVLLRLVEALRVVLGAERRHADLGLVLLHPLASALAARVTGMLALDVGGDERLPERHLPLLLADLQADVAEAERQAEHAGVVLHVRAVAERDVRREAVVAGDGDALV